MRKSTSLVGILGSLVGVGVLVLPSASFAATKVTTVTNTVTLGIENVLALTLVGGEPNEKSDGTTLNNGVTYNRATSTYTGTINTGDTNDGFGTSTFRVTCNYLVGDDENENDNCSNGWQVTAKSGEDEEEIVSGTPYAAMLPSDYSTGSNPARIYSKNKTLSGSESTWLMKVTGISKTYSTNNTFTPTAWSGTISNVSYNYANFDLIPPYSYARTVAEGNTFRTVNSVDNTYIGDEQFKVTYGVSAGSGTPAGTYTGHIIYTLSPKAASS